MGNWMKKPPVGERHGLFDEVGFFTQVLTETEISQVMTPGLMRVAAVEPTTKLTVSWG